MIVRSESFSARTTNWIPGHSVELQTSSFIYLPLMFEQRHPLLFYHPREVVLVGVLESRQECEHDQCGVHLDQAREPGSELVGGAPFLGVRHVVEGDHAMP